MATSGYFSTDSVGSFYFTFEWWRTGYSSERNEHYIHYVIKTHNTPGNYRTVYDRNLYVNGGLIYSDGGGVPMYDDEILAEGDFTIASYNSAGDGSFSASFDAGVGISSGSNVGGSGSWDLDRIPRYADIYNAYVESTGLTTAVIRYSVSRNANIYCSVDGQAWGNPRVNNTTSGSFTVSGLSPGVQHSFAILSRATDSGLDRVSGTFYGTTKDIAKITKAPNIEHGNSLKVEYSNPSGSSMEIGIWKTDGLTALTGGYRVCTGSSYTFNFTDEELDNIYKQYGRYSNTVTLRVYIKTAGNSNFLNYKEFLVTLKGNQKTANLYPVENVHKRGKVSIYKNRTPKKAVMWTYESTGWKRGI